MNDFWEKYLNFSNPQAVDHKVLLARLDPQAGGWDKEMAEGLISLSVKCVNSTREDRPDLEKEIIPELRRFHRRTRILPSASGEKGRKKGEFLLMNYLFSLPFLQYQFDVKVSLYLQ